jgi:hypothetical protein
MLYITIYSLLEWKGFSTLSIWNLKKKLSNKINLHETKEIINSIIVNKEK